VLATGIIPGVVVYIVAIFLVPRRPEAVREERPRAEQTEANDESGDTAH